MSYKDQQLNKAVESRDAIFADTGKGICKGKQREFVLKEPTKNLWEGIRDEAIEYFKLNHVTWWGEAKTVPTGHLLSSQVASLNHLFILRKNKAFADSVIKGIDATLIGAEIVDDGYVEFEFIGERQYLKESAFKRGENCTSIDAVMVGKRQGGEKVLVFIEWKYTESHISLDKYVPQRATVYDQLIIGEDSPFIPTIEPRHLYFDPFYQMMRQTLLAKEAVRHLDHGCSDYLNVNVVPEGNIELRNRITSPHLSGDSVSNVWKGILRHPEKYICVSPEAIMKPLTEHRGCEDFLDYLNARYWN